MNLNELTSCFVERLIVLVDALSFNIFFILAIDRFVERFNEETDKISSFERSFFLPILKLN